MELGDYLEQYFPFLGIRFISVNDGYDSKNFEGTTGGLDVAFKNMIYDFYSREFSKKQKIAWKRMAEKGEYNATFTMYGYRRDRGSIHQLAIHEETGEIVREIFSLAASGMSPLKIARMLNEKGIPSPSEMGTIRGGVPLDWRKNTPHDQGRAVHWNNGLVKNIFLHSWRKTYQESPVGMGAC